MTEGTATACIVFALGWKDAKGDGKGDGKEDAIRQLFSGEGLPKVGDVLGWKVAGIAEREEGFHIELNLCRLNKD